MQKSLGKAFTLLLQDNGWKKLSTPTVTRGATAVPRSRSATETIGLRLDYDNFIEKGDNKTKWHRFKLQVNAGDKIPISFKKWRENQPRKTHAVMATIEIRDGADQDEIEAALKEATKDVEGV